MDAVTKIFLVLFITALSYLFFSAIAAPLFARQPRTMVEAMQQMMNFSSANIFALVAAIGIGLFASFKLNAVQDARKTSGGHALSIIKRKLSPDEKALLKEIEKAGVITQDSLRARLAWSKAKVSTILTRLDRMNLIQRERQGKTYKVFLQKDMR